MANEINKIDSVSINSALKYTPTVTEQSEPTKPVPEVQVSSGVDNVIRDLVSDSSVPIDDGRVDAMIKTLNSGEYKIDYNRLAHSLVLELINTSKLPGESIHGNTNK